jgi:ribosomal 50S subunit-recycling heat shock protein
MRIDKFLKNSRLIKRRTIAKDACDQSRIEINGKAAKPGSVVAVGDHVTLRIGDHFVTVEVLVLTEHVTKDGAKEMYRILDEK